MIAPTDQAKTQSRILIVKMSSLGDLVHALPAVHRLKVGLNAAVDWVVQPEYVDLVRGFTDVDRIIVYPRRSFFRSFRRFVRELRAQNYDLIVDLQGILKSALVAHLALGEERLGPSFHREGSRRLYSAVAGPANRNRHAVDQNLDIVRYLQWPLTAPEFHLAVPLALLSEPPPRVALIPFSRWPSKNWPVAAWLELGRELREQKGASLFLIGGAEDVAAGAQLEREFKGRVLNLVGKLSLPQLAGLLKEMNLVIAGDTGPMHLAAAVGAPVLALFGPTDPVRTGPYGPVHRVVKNKLRCQPCFDRICRFRDHSCLRAITPAQVLLVALEMLGQTEEK